MYIDNREETDEETFRGFLTAMAVFALGAFMRAVKMINNVVTATPPS